MLGMSRMTVPSSSRTEAPPRLRWQILPAGDVLRDAAYSRLWLSILVAAFGGQISALALPLTAVLLLQATPAQMGVLGAIGIVPFVLFLLPAGVWLDRARALPVYLAGEVLLAGIVAIVPLAWALDALHMSLVCAVAFCAGCVAVTSGTAAQMLLTQIVPRERLVEAHGKNAFAGSVAEIAGPAMAGALVKFVGAPLTLLMNAALLLASAALLRRVRPVEAPRNNARGHFWNDLKLGIRFVTGQRLLISMALAVGIWQVCQTSAMVVQVLFATRELGLADYQLGMCFMASGVGTIAASVFGHRVSRRVGPGPCLILGFAVSGAGWLQLALAPPGAAAVVSFVVMLLCFGAGTAFIFMNMLALRQAVTPPALLGRMTGTMRWLTLLPAAPGALLGGYLGERYGLRHAMGFGGGGAILLAVLAWRFSVIRLALSLPAPVAEGPPPAR